MNDLVGNANPISGFKGKPLHTGKVCLHDADYLKYTCVDKVWKQSKDKITFPPIEKIVDEVLDEIFIKITDPMIFCFSGKSEETFRASLAMQKKYKGNRDYTHEYRHYDRKFDDSYNVVKIIQDKYSSLLFKDLEADDIVCALQNEHTYIMSQDKDQKQKPGWHYDWTKNEIIQISNHDALYFLCWQMIAGDGGDNIPGLKGTGKVGANKILDSVPSSQLVQTVLYTYQKKFGIFIGTDMFTEMWQLLKMRENQGDYFQEKYKLMFNTRDYAISRL